MGLQILQSQSSSAFSSEQIISYEKRVCLANRRDHSTEFFQSLLTILFSRIPKLSTYTKSLIMHSPYSSTDPPQVILELGKPTISMQLIQEGNDIYFDCKVDSNPSPSKPIIWKFNGKRLPPQPGK